jgi:hypothetical protein
MKRILAVGFTLAMVLGTAVGAMAFDTQRVAAPVEGLQVIEDNMGTLAPKDYCNISCDNLAGYVWIFTASWLGPGCGFYELNDAVECYTTCLPPYYPFLIDRLRFGGQLSDCPGPDNFDLVSYFSVHEKVEDLAHPCSYNIGPELWRSPDLADSPPPGWYGRLGYYPLPWITVHGPVIIDFHIVSVSEAGYFGWLTDNTAYGTTPCWNWLDAWCLYYTTSNFEFYYELGWLEGNLLMWAYGWPQWNVAVDLASFEAVSSDGMITLNWRTMSEISNASWIIERDGKMIATLEGQGDKETSTDYTYTDRDVVNGLTYSYTLKAVNYDGNEDVYGPVTATPAASGTLPSEYALSQNYPNPFNASTVIRYSLASNDHVSLKIYNVYGQEVASLVDADQKAGQYTVQWNGSGISSGVYFYTLNAGDFSQTKKMVYTK